MSEFTYRTEDLRSEEILPLYVETERDKDLVCLLRSTTPLVIEGSRGTGKTFLLRVAERQMLADFREQRVLPVYISFRKSSLINSPNSRQFQSWMISYMCSRILRTLYSEGLLARPCMPAIILAGKPIADLEQETKLEQIADAFENSYLEPGEQVNDDDVPTVESLRDAIQDICEDLNINRLVLLFDEAAHIFRPEQQRQFFTLYRDLRSPYMTCKAAVYPGVTSYGDSFEAAHDARIMSLQRDVWAQDYRREMREIVLKQADSSLQRAILSNGENFDALAYAVSGNPRLLLKIVAKAGQLRGQETQTTIKDFFRVGIWEEHTGLSERYPGHRGLIDWGRSFVETIVIPDTVSRNEAWKKEGKQDRTSIIWIHRDAPAAVTEALRLLCYTGIVSKMDSGIVGTRGAYGTRYLVNLGCVAAQASNPVNSLTEMRKGFTIKRFTEYGANTLSLCAEPSKALLVR